MTWLQEADHFGGHPFEEKEVVLSTLQRDTYQRPVDPLQVDRIVKEFSPALARTLQVSQRADGSLWIVDGEHTREALVRKGLTVWNARIHHNLTLTEEANFFVDLNDSQRRVAPNFKFRARLIGSHPDMIAIAEVLKDHGLAIKETEGIVGPTNLSLTPINSVRMISKIYARGGQDLLQTVLEVAKAAWPDPSISVTDRYNTRVMPGLATLLVNSTHSLDFDRLKFTTGASDPKHLEKLVKGVSGANRIIAQRLYKDYLKGAGLSSTPSGQKSRKIYTNSPVYPYLAVNEVTLYKEINVIGVWNPTTESTYRKNFKGLVKTEYLHNRP